MMFLPIIGTMILNLLPFMVNDKKMVMVVDVFAIVIVSKVGYHRPPSKDAADRLPHHHAGLGRVRILLFIIYK
jgi:hypothetical protein